MYSPAGRRVMRLPDGAFTAPKTTTPRPRIHKHSSLFVLNPMTGHEPASEFPKYQCEVWCPALAPPSLSHTSE